MNASADRKYDVVGVGRAYIDVIGRGSYDLLKKHDIPLDTGRYFDVPAIQSIITELKDVTLCPGGTIPNTLSGMAALGGRIGYFGKMARDESGRVFSDDLAARGIDVLCDPFVAEADMSGTCVVLLTEGGERSFALHKGCVDSFGPPDFDAFDFGRAKYFLVAANLLSNAQTYEVFAKAVEKAAAASCKLVFSLSEVRDWSQRQAMALEVVLPHADILIGNEVENDALFALTGPVDNDRQMVVTTLGSRGAKARLGGVEEYVPAYHGGDIVSSLGAGDQFLAGFLKAQADGQPIKESLALASRCAAAILKTTEARPSVETDWSSLL